MPKKHGKKYRQIAEKLGDLQKTYPLSEAVKMLKDSSPSKFDATVEVHFKINADQKQADQLVRGTVTLPHGTGKKMRIAAFVDDAQAKETEKAGADIAGTAKLTEQINKGKINFDIAVATPDQMKELGKIAKILGQKGLMPNPKAGTVGPDAKKMIEDIRKGKVEFKMDKQSIIHLIFGKVSFDEKKLGENLQTLIEALMEAKPSGIKGSYIETITVAASMGPGIKVSLDELKK